LLTSLICFGSVTSLTPIGFRVDGLGTLLLCALVDFVMGVIVVVGRAIALLFTLAMFLGSGFMWFSLGILLTRRCMTL
jgi:hypothetical protein